jgi:hypothetical protein
MHAPGVSMHLVLEHQVLTPGACMGSHRKHAVITPKICNQLRYVGGAETKKVKLASDLIKIGESSGPRKSAEQQQDILDMP